MIGLDVRYPHQLSQLSADTQRALITTDRDSWSGMTLYLPNGEIVTVLNPTHSDNRRNATLMEEVGHVHLHHEASVIRVDKETGILARSYDAATEREAYWFGSAVLAPKLGLKRLYATGRSRADAARYYAVSLDLIRMRSDLHGLRTS